MCLLTETRALSAQGEKRALVGNLTMPTDPFTMSLASLMLGLAVLSGCLGPALRALRVDPAITLREP